MLLEKVFCSPFPHNSKTGTPCSYESKIRRERLREREKEREKERERERGRRKNMIDTSYVKTSVRE